MKSLRFLRIVGLSFLAIAIAHFPAFAQNPWMDAMCTHYAGFYTNDGKIDSWGAFDPHSVRREWGIGMTSHYSYPISNPTLTILVNGIPSSNIYSTSLIDAGNQFGWPTNPYYENATLGFDSSRTFEPLLIPANASQYLQKMTIKVTPRDGLYAPGQQDVMIVRMTVSIFGPCQANQCVPPGTPVPPPGGDSRGETDWTFDNPNLDQEYTITAMVPVNNPSATPINSKPAVRIWMQVFHQFHGQYAQSVDIADSTLYKIFGTGADGVRFYTDKSDVFWQPRLPDENYSINYMELNETVTDTTPPVIVPTITGTLGNNGWYTSDVTVSWNVSDPESGIASSTGSEPTTLTTDTPGTTLTCSATNGVGLTSSASVTIKIDKSAPHFDGISVDNGLLWPPNHKMVPIKVTAFASDVGSGIVSCKIISVTSNEPIDGLGDGDTSPDWQITGDLTVNLRAERSGAGAGRLYTITVLCVDKAGNGSTAIVTATVPHDMGK